MILTSRAFSINSRTRISGTHTDFVYKVELPRNNKFNRVAVLDFSCPKSWYNVREGLNYFYITHGNNPEQKITVPIGNYSRKTLALALNNLFQNAITISYPNQNVDMDDGKYTFTGHGNHPHSIRFENGMTEVLGFEPNTSYDLVNNILKSVNVCNFQLESTITLLSDICDGERSDILLNIYGMANPNFSTIVWHLTDLYAHSKKLTTNASNTYYFKLVDEDGILLNTNGLNLVFSILVFEETPLYRMLNGYIKYRVGRDDLEDQRIEEEEKKLK